MPVVVIAGGAGFLGSHLTELFLSKNYRVVIVDNMETGNKSFIAHLTAHPRFGYIEHNLNLGLPEKLESCDILVHLLAEELYLSGPENINLDNLLTNSLSTYHLLELAKSSQARFLLASSLDVYEGIVSSSSLSQYFGAREVDERTFSYNEAKRYAESLAWEYFKKYNLDIRIARLPEAYGPRMDFKSSSNLGRLLSEVTEGANLTVFGDGLDKDYYIYASDAAEGLLNCLASAKTTGKIYNLCDSSPITQLELAYLLKSLAAPGTQIVFRPSVKTKTVSGGREIDGGNLKDIGFKQRVKLKDGLKLTLDFLGFSGAKVPLPAKSATQKSTIQTTTLPKVPEGIFNQRLKTGSLTSARDHLPKLNRKYLTYAALALLLFFAPFIIVPPVSLAYNLGLSFLKFKNLEADFRKLDIKGAETDGEKLAENLSAARKSFGNLLFPGVFKKPYARFLTAAVYTSKAANNLLAGLTPTASYIENAAADSPEAKTAKYPYVDADNSVAYIDSALDGLSLAEAELKDASLQNLSFGLGELSEDLSQKIATAKTVAKALKGVVKVAPELLGFDGTKNYLILLQNSNELRPTGGFIGSVATVSVSGGKMGTPRVEDIYDIDGQLGDKVSLPAPKVIKDNLNTAALRLRDANFDPSFPKSSEQIRVLYAAATGTKVDGVVAVDLGFVKSMMQALGPIFLSTYNETVGSDDLFEKVQFHSEANYTAGGSNKKTFLSLLSQKFLEQFLTLEKSKYLPVIKALLSSLEEKHLLVELYTPTASALADLGFRGEVKSVSGDYLMVVDANVGSNKANYFVKRSIFYEAERANRDGEVNSQLTVSYNHTGTGNAWPGGTYKNYLKVMLPLKASLTKARLVSQEGTEEDITPRVEIDEQDGKTTFATLLEIQAGTKVSVVLNYVLPPSVFPLKGDAYDLYVQKQPGTQADPFRAKFTLPFGADLDENLAQGFTRQGSAVIFEGNLRKDLELSIPLRAK